MRHRLSTIMLLPRMWVSLSFSSIGNLFSSTKLFNSKIHSLTNYYLIVSFFLSGKFVDQEDAANNGTPCVAYCLELIEGPGNGDHGLSRFVYLGMCSII